MFALMGAFTAARANDLETFEKLESAWNNAHLQGDVTALDRLWAEDFTLIVPGMAPMTKQDAMALWENVPVAISAYRSDALMVRRSGSISVVTGRIERSRSFSGRSANDRWRFTKIYQRKRGEWKVIHFHASALEEQ
jgi:ketosteroid isomerase-like protein